MSLLGQITENALTSDLEIEQKEGEVPNTFVDGRNHLFLSFAAVLAKQRGIKISWQVSARQTSQATLTAGMSLSNLLMSPSTLPWITTLLSKHLSWLDKAETWELADQLVPFDYVREKDLDLLQWDYRKWLWRLSSLPPTSAWFRCLSFTERRGLMFFAPKKSNRKLGNLVYNPSQNLSFKRVYLRCPPSLSLWGKMQIPARPHLSSADCCQWIFRWTGMTYDFGDIKAIYKDFLRTPFGSSLSQWNPALYEHDCWNMVYWIFQTMSQELPDERSLRLEYVRLYETPTAFAEFRREWLDD